MNHYHRLWLLLLAGTFLLSDADLSFGLPPADDESPLAKEPATYQQAFDAAVLMVDIARPQLARRYLEQVLVKYNATDDDLLKLRDQHGPAVFLKLANFKELKPFSTQLLDRVNAAFRKRGADPARVDSLIADIYGTPERRAVATLTLRAAGASVVPRLLQQFDAAAVGPKRDQLMYAMSKLGDQIAPPLIAALDSSSSAQRNAAIQALGWVGTRKDIPNLWFAAFNPGEELGVRKSARASIAKILDVRSTRVETIRPAGVAVELKRIARSYFHGTHRWTVGEDGDVSLWVWDEKKRRVDLASLAPKLASIHAGSRFARQAMVMAPDDREAQSLYLGLWMSSESLRTGWDKPLPSGPGSAYNMALLSGPNMVSETLADALRHRNTAAVMGLLQVMGEIGSKEELLSKACDSSPLLAALSYPDPRVQFLAASMILQVDPDGKFRGASQVVRILTRALNSSQTSAALVVDANVQRGISMSSMLGEMGYTALTERTGKKGFQAATLRADVDLIVLEVNTLRWGLSQTIANLRTDTRTSHIPIVIYGSEQMRPRVTSLMSRYSLITYMLEATQTDRVRRQIEPFLKSATGPRLTAQQRATQVGAAVFWFGRIADGRRTEIYDIRPAESSLFQVAIAEADLAEDAIIALAAISTKKAQSDLKDITINKNLDLTRRQAAATALRGHLKRFGDMLIRSEKIELINARKAADDPNLATDLAAILGSLKPGQRRGGQKEVGNRLRNFPPPSLPLTAPPKPGP
jgi:CheY-like chemotaxis protein